MQVLLVIQTYLFLKHNDWQLSLLTSELRGCVGLAAVQSQLHRLWLQKTSPAQNRNAYIFCFTGLLLPFCYLFATNSKFSQISYTLFLTVQHHYRSQSQSHTEHGNFWNFGIIGLVQYTQIEYVQAVITAESLQCEISALEKKERYRISIEYKKRWWQITVYEQGFKKNGWPQWRSYICMEVIRHVGMCRYLSTSRTSWFAALQYDTLHFPIPGFIKPFFSVFCPTIIFSHDKEKKN